MTPAAHYRMFGHYDAWADGRLQDAAARLSTEQYRADRGAFFKSGLVGTAPELDLLIFQRLSVKSVA